MFVYVYQCDACNFCGRARWGQIGYYVFPDGERLPARTDTVWCRECNTFTLAENLPTVGAMLEEIERLQNNRTDEFDAEIAEMLEQSLDEHVASRLAAFQDLRDRFRDRRSPNRCIECGANNFDEVRDDRDCMPKELPHPNCQGVLRLVETYHASPATYFTLDREGNRIPAVDET